jgi:CRISPR type III-B/RAMP module RAMP protein Cmr1
VMTKMECNIQFITPCFCAGADQTQPELRASAVRGQLRWWFRALGGEFDQEAAAFGSVHQSHATASSVSVRVVARPSGGEKDWSTKINRTGTDSKTYLLGFFCSNRLQVQAALPPGSNAKVSLLARQPLSQHLDQAIRIFFSVGALGYRATRCAGAFSSAEYALNAQRWSELSHLLKTAGFKVALVDQVFRDWVQLCGYAGDLLKNRLRKDNGITAGRNGTLPNALGSANPRQASVVHLRPVRIDGKLRLALLEAPHGRILGSEARKAHRGRPPVLTLAGFVKD